MSAHKQVEASTDEVVNINLKPSYTYYADQSTYYLNGIGIENCNKLADAECYSVGQLAWHLNLETLSKTSRIPLKMLKTFQLRALSMLTGEIYHVSSFRFPEKVIYFDIETEQGGGRIWLIGCLINEIPFQFYGDTWIDEYGVIMNFLDLVYYYSDYPLVSYSGTNFDLRFLEEALESYGEKVDLWHRHIDLCNLLKQCFIFPTRSYGLKSIGKALGYKFANPELNGLTAANLYEEHIETGNILNNSVYTYNLDDVRSLQYIVKKLRMLELNK
jgi:predicted RecB family nuclease